MTQPEIMPTANSCLPPADFGTVMPLMMIGLRAVVNCRVCVVELPVVVAEKLFDPVGAIPLMETYCDGYCAFAAEGSANSVMRQQPAAFAFLSHMMAKL